MERAQKKPIIRDLYKKMVLLAGPRQAGKTTLAKSIAEEFNSAIYLSFDRLADRNIIYEEAWLPSVELVILDEIHKMDNWKNYLKGVFDTKLPHQKILVTGSARLEIFNQVGDSPAGRFFLHRLMPLSPAECEQMTVSYTIEQFLERGGFPEPFFAENAIDAKRWRLQYVDSLTRQDVLEFDNIQNIKAIQLIFELLRNRVGSPISYSSLAEDTHLSPTTVKKYIQILEALYIIFLVTPFSNNIARSLLKEPKIYFFDTGLVSGDEGVRFENLIASCLLKHVFGKIDYEGEMYSLNYLQTKERKEVDFAIIKDYQIERIIEVKLSDPNPSKGLCYFHNKYNLPAIQIVKNLKREKKEGGIEVQDAKNFLKTLFI
ncbi:MAG: ATP-binding protein [Candidatus Protochlamydia sp.]|nr:ATP-binding protein [Candidatus Protochlamydia sp.]